jgi:hypothetical protein
VAAASIVFLLAGATAGLAGLVTGTTPRSDAQLAEDDFQRAKTSEGGLKQIKSNKSREPKPIKTMVTRQQKADQDETSGESANNHFHNSKVENYNFFPGHNPMFFMFRYRRRYWN